MSGEKQTNKNPPSKPQTKTTQTKKTHQKNPQTSSRDEKKVLYEKSQNEIFVHI